ncbi:MAG TPA: hypothetical protein PKW33_17755 [Anaerolineaceae bacterium]|nr:hypothetical protein [Anaerolineaceae bacterium]HPN53445.1 hypothetical protein [Anaerolineaceae bacterium]
MMEQAILLLCLLLNLAGLLGFSAALVEKSNIKAEEDWAAVVLWVYFSVALYVEVTLLSAAGIYNVISISLVNAVFLIFTFRQIPFLSDIFRHVLKTLSSALAGFRWLAVPLLVFLFLQLASVVSGNDIAYQINNISYFLNNRSTLSYDFAHLTVFSEFALYYPKGLESLLSFFYQFPLARHTLLLYKLSSIAALWMLFTRKYPDRQFALLPILALISLDVTATSLSSLKNDFIIGVAAVVGVAMVFEKDARLLPGFLSLFAWSLAIKPNAMFYMVPAFVVALPVLFRSRPIKALLLFPGLLLAGSFTYWVNLFRLGNPVYPFAVSILGIPLFQGNGQIASTLILNNVNASLPIFFLRGALRTLGPVGLIFLAGWIAVFAIDTLAKIPARWRSWDFLLQFIFFPLIFFFAYLVTPFSDNFGPQHSFLQSGNTIRYLFPFFMYLLLAGGEAVWPMKWVQKVFHSKITLWAVVIFSLLNQCWYDLVSMLLKPENAFSEITSVLPSFNNLYLLAAFLGVIALAFLACAFNRRAGFILLMLLGVLMYAVNFPQSSGYSLRFKQVGSPSQAYAFLNQMDLADRQVSLVGSAYLAGTMADFLLQTRHTYQVPENPYNGQYDVLIVAAAEKELSNDFELGRTYGTTFNYFNPAQMPGGFALAFQDDFYLIFVKDNP